MFDFMDPVVMMKAAMAKIFASLPQAKPIPGAPIATSQAAPDAFAAGPVMPAEPAAVTEAVGHWVDMDTTVGAGPVDGPPQAAPVDHQPQAIPADHQPRTETPEEAARRKADEAAARLTDATAAKDPAAFQQALAGKSSDEVAAIRKAYELSHPGHDFHEDMHSAGGELGVTNPALDASLEKDRVEVVAQATAALQLGAKPDTIKDTLRHLPPDKRREIIDALPEDARLVAGAFEGFVVSEEIMMAQARRQVEGLASDAGDEAMRLALRFVPAERRAEFTAALAKDKREAAGAGLVKLDEEDDRLDRNVSCYLDPSLGADLGDKAPRSLFEGLPRDRWDEAIERLPADTAERAREQVARIEENERKDVAVQNGVVAVLAVAHAKGDAGAAAVASAIDRIPPDRRDEALDALAAMDPTGTARAKAEEALAARQRKLAGASEALFKASIVAGGTDEKTIRKTLLGLSPAEAQEIKAIYEEAHSGRSLEDDLLGDLDSGSERLDADFVRAKLGGRETEAKAVMLQIGAADDNDLIFQVLESAAGDPDQLAALEESFKARQAQDEDAVDDGLLTIDDMLKDELGSEKLERAQALREGRVADAYAIAAEDAMEGGGTDEEGVNHAVSRCPLKLREEMAEAYARRNPGKSLLTEITSEIEDEAERNIALGLFKDEQDRVLAAQLKKDGVDAVLAECKGRSPEELQAARDRFNADYGKEYEDEDAPQGETAFDRFLDDEADDKVELAAVKQLTTEGTLEPALAVLYAGHGMGTTEDMMKDALRDPRTGRPRAREEMDAMRARFKELGQELHAGGSDPDLDGFIDSELGGRDAFDAKLDLKGAPTTIEDKVARVKATHRFERQGALVGLADMLAPSAENAEQLQYNALTYLGAKIERGEASPEEEAEFERRYDYYQGNVASYRAGKDTVTSYLSTGATAVVGAVTTALSAGSLGPAWAAAMGSLYGGGAGLFVNTGINGDAVSSSDLAASIVNTLGSAASAGILKIPGVGKFFEGLISNGVAREGAMKAVGALFNGGVGLLTNEQLMDGKLGIGDALGKLLASSGGAFLKGAGGKALSNLLSSLGLAAAQLGKTGATQLTHFVNSGLSGAAGDALAMSVDPEMWKGEYGGKWLQKLMTSGVTQLIGSFGSWKAFETGMKGYAQKLGISEKEMWLPGNQARISERHQIVTAAKKLDIAEEDVDTEESRAAIGRYRYQEFMKAEEARQEEFRKKDEANMSGEEALRARLRDMQEDPASVGSE